MINTDKYIGNNLFLIDKTKINLNEKQIKLIEKFCKNDKVKNASNDQLDCIFDLSQSEAINFYNINELVLYQETFFKRHTNNYSNTYILTDSFGIEENLLKLFYSLNLFSYYKKDMILYNNKIITNQTKDFILAPYRF